MYITFQDAVKYLREGIEERGEDYVNGMFIGESGVSTCVYRSPVDGSPSCGVGLVLHKAGFDLAKLTPTENEHTFTRLYEILRDVRMMFMHHQTVSFLRKFQNYQDDEIPWGDALTYALNDVPAPDPEKDVMPESF